MLDLWQAFWCIYCFRPQTEGCKHEPTEWHGWFAWRVSITFEEFPRNSENKIVDDLLIVSITMLYDELVIN